jgi:hypothetical protein
MPSPHLAVSRYGMALLPARPYMPPHKIKVESALSNGALRLQVIRQLLKRPGLKQEPLHGISNRRSTAGKPGRQRCEPIVERHRQIISPGLAN